MDFSDRQQMLMAAAFAAAESEISALLPAGLAGRIMFESRATDTPVTTGPLYSESREDQAHEAASRFFVANTLSAKATNDDERGFWKAEAGYNAYRAVEIWPAILDPANRACHAASDAAEAYTRGLPGSATGKRDVLETIEGFRLEAREFQAGEDSSQAYVAAEVLPLTDGGRHGALDAVGGFLAAVIPVDEEDDRQAVEEAEIEAAQTGVDVSDDYDDDAPLPSSELMDELAALDELATLAAKEELEGDAPRAEVEEVTWADRKFGVGGSVAPPVPMIEICRADQDQLDLAHEYFHAPDEKDQDESGSEYYPPATDDIFVVYSDSPGFGREIWGTGRTADAAVEAAKHTSNQKLPQDQRERFLSAMESGDEVKVAGLTYACAQNLAFPEGALHTTWELTADGKAVGIGDAAALRAINHEIQRCVRPAWIERAVTGALESMQPGSDANGIMHVPAAAVGEATQHLTAIATFSMAHAGLAVGQHSPVAEALARDGIAPALRAEMASKKLLGYTEPYNALNVAIERAGSGSLSSSQANAVGRALTARMLNTLTDPIDQVAAHLAPELGVTAKPDSDRYLDITAVVYKAPPQRPTTYYATSTPSLAKTRDNQDLQVQGD
jgi:hypothetical protein